MAELFSQLSRKANEYSLTFWHAQQERINTVLTKYTDKAYSISPLDLSIPTEKFDRMLMFYCPIIIICDKSVKMMREIQKTYMNDGIFLTDTTKDRSFMVGDTVICKVFPIGRQMPDISSHASKPTHIDTKYLIPSLLYYASHLTEEEFRSFRPILMPLMSQFASVKLEGFTRGRPQREVSPLTKETQHEGVPKDFAQLEGFTQKRVSKGPWFKTKLPVILTGIQAAKQHKFGAIDYSTSVDLLTTDPTIKDKLAEELAMDQKSMDVFSTLIDHPGFPFRLEMFLYKKEKIIATLTVVPSDFVNTTIPSSIDIPCTTKEITAMMLHLYGWMQEKKGREFYKNLYGIATYLMSV